MPGPIHTRRIPARTVASISRKVTPDEIAGFMRGAIDTLRECVEAGTLESAGAPFAVYHEPISVEQPGLVELCWPVERPREPFRLADLVEHPETEVACCAIQLRETDRVAAAFEALYAWVAGQGRSPCGPAREVYLTPRDRIGPDDLYIEIEVPVSRL